MKSQISIATIGPQVSGIPFMVSGTISLFPDLSYADDVGAFVSLPSGSSVVSALASGSWAFQHAGFEPGSHAIAVDEMSTSGFAVSNIFSVDEPHTITPTAPTGTIAGASFTFTGSISGFTTTPALQFRFDGALLSDMSGGTASGWSTTLTAPASGSHTVTVTDGQVSGTASFITAAVPVTTPSADQAAIAAPTAATLIDNQGHTWGITAGAQVSVNGIPDATTANVTKLAWVSGSIWQENANRLWWAKTSPAAAWSPAPGTPVSPLGISTLTGAFKVVAGKIQSPSGGNFIAKGINVNQEQGSTVCTSPACTPLLTLFPGLNCVRVPFHDYSPPSVITTFVAEMTAKQIVMIIEDHTGISVQPATGSALATQQAWYSSMASTFKNNPYVWFGTPNEPYPQQTSKGDDVTTQHVETYNTIRATGNTNPILLELIGGGNPGNLPGGNSFTLTASRYATMTNVIWDLHQYDYAFPNPGGYSTNETTISSGIASYIARVQTVTSADGLVPVIIGEYGNSTDGSNTDPGGTQLVDAVAHSGHGFLAWHWRAGGASDNLTDGSGNLTSYGSQVAALIAAV